MKNLFTDPLSWSTTAVGTERAFAVRVVLQLVGAWGIWHSHGQPGLVILFALALPFYYIYALHQVVLRAVKP